MSQWKLYPVAVAWLAALCAGCAKPAVVPAAANNAEVYLTMSGGQWHPAENSYSRGIRNPYRVDRKTDAPQKFTVIKLKNDEGRIIGTRIVPVSSGEILIDVLARRMQELGYSVKVVPKRPGSGYVIDISDVAAEVEQGSGLFALEGTCRLQATLEIWENGTMMWERDYESETADYAATEQDLLHIELMKQASEQIISEYISAITAANATHQRH